MLYINREYYNSLYAEMNEADFARLEKQAENRLNVYTHNRAKLFMDSFDEENATNFEKMIYEAVKGTLCELVSRMSLAEATAENEGITSISNKGRSESYKVYSVKERKEELDEIMRVGLSGTGLVGAL